ncbi:FtsK/SpoIIIE domain-containing protein [Lactococcus garvieae]|uniref:FtsK/SpoIIIE domain-containing protein n=1 Tax=Lactococcus garvieae TaxID=1363 RepID=UPI002550CB70|nr:FtsK/SpoIIIE domain-containing protein [Lactococcus garvieae]
MPKIKLTKQVTLDLSGTSSNLLIVGPTGSGKTFLLYHLLLSLYAQKCLVYCVDFKSGSLYSLIKYNTPNGEHFSANTSDEFEEILDEIIETISRRFQRLSDPSAPLDVIYTDLEPQDKPVYLFIDEYSSALAPILANKETKAQGNRINAKMMKIIQLIRQASGGVILSFQKMSADILPTAITDNMAKIGLGNLSTPSKIQLFGKAVDLPLADMSLQGAGYLQRPTDSKPVWFQVPDLSDMDFRKVLEHLTKATN